MMQPDKPLETKFSAVLQHMLGRWYRSPEEQHAIEQLGLDDLVFSLCALDARMIWQDRREVHLSKEINQNPATLKNLEGFKRVKRMCERGENLQPLLSVRLPALKGMPRAKSLNEVSDNLLEAYGIYHLHLPNNSAGSAKKRSRDLLFAYFCRGHAFFLDIVEGHKFPSDHLLGVIVRNWPQVEILHEMKGVIGLSRPISSEERETLRFNGINVPFEHEGKVYMSPRGLSTRVSDLLCMSNMAHASPTKEHDCNDDFQGTTGRAAQRR